MFTNQTPNYGLPQYTSPDELNVLVDFNGAMSDIDTQMKSNELAAQDAKNTAVSANNKADANTLSIQTLNSDINDPATGVGPRVTALEGRVNTIDSLIGNGVPTVGDDTLIGGINANAASIGDLANLDTTDKSSLVAAINEVAQGGGGGQSVDADDVTYDNTESGLSANNVQAAIDELAQGVGDTWTEETVSVPLSSSLASIKTFTTAPKEIVVLAKQSTGNAVISIPLYVPENATDNYRNNYFTSDSAFNYLLNITAEYDASTKVLSAKWEHGTSVTFTLSVIKVMFR